MHASVVIRADGNAYAMIVKALPEGFVLREAVAADGPRLAEVCRNAAILLSQQCWGGRRGGEVPPRNRAPAATKP